MDLIQKKMRRRQAGMAFVETVIVLPLLCYMLFGIVECAVLFGRWQVLTNAAREGAREAVVFRRNCDPNTVETDVQNTVSSYAASLGMSLSSINVAGQCSGGGLPTTVTANYTYVFQVFPGFSDNFGPTLNLVGTSTMRNEG